MKLSQTILIIASIVATAFLFPAADAAPVPYVCSDKVTSSCGHDVCFAPSSTQAPRCEDLPIGTVRVPKMGVCTEGKAPCYSPHLVCVTRDGVPVACVPDPCATTNCFGTTGALL